MTDRLNPKVVAFSLAGVSAISYVACATLFAIAPLATLGFFKNMFHGVDITKIAVTNVSLENTITGFVAVTLLSLAFGWLFAVLYNYLLARMR